MKIRIIFRSHRLHHLPLFFLFLAIICTGTQASADSFTQESKQDLQIRNAKGLRITNLRGRVQMKNWTLDMVRIQITKTVKAPSAEQAESLFKGTQVWTQETSQEVEISAQYGYGLSLAEKAKELEADNLSMDLVIWAPTYLKLKLWGGKAGLEVENWQSSVEARNRDGSILLKQIKAPMVSAICNACEIRMQGIQAREVRASGGSQTISLENVKAEEVFAETLSGEIRLLRIQGKQTLVSGTGPIRAVALSGRVEYHSGSGLVEIRESRGFYSGFSQSGPQVIHVLQWDGFDRALFESETGSIHLSFPWEMEGDFEWLSPPGKWKSDAIAGVGVKLSSGRGPHLGLEKRTGRWGTGGGHPVRAVAHEGPLKVEIRLPEKKGSS